MKAQARLCYSSMSELVGPIIDPWRLIHSHQRCERKVPWELGLQMVPGFEMCQGQQCHSLDWATSPDRSE